LPRRGTISKYSTSYIIAKKGMIVARKMYEISMSCEYAVDAAVWEWIRSLLSDPVALSGASVIP
jgi:hypothetical protein